MSDDLREVSLEDQLFDEQQKNTKLWDSICDVGRELGLTMPEQATTFSECGVAAVRKLKEKAKPAPVSNIVRYVVEAPGAVSPTYWELPEDRQDECDKIVIDREWWESLSRMLGQYGIDQMSAAVDICAAALEWGEEPLGHGSGVLAEAINRYNHYVEKRSER